MLNKFSIIYTILFDWNNWVKNISLDFLESTIFLYLNLDFCY